MHRYDSGLRGFYARVDDDGAELDGGSDDRCCCWGSVEHEGCYDVGDCDGMVVRSVLGGNISARFTTIGAFRIATIFSLWHWRREFGFDCFFVFLDLVGLGE